MSLTSNPIRLTTYIINSLLPITALIGILTNTIAFIVFSRKTFRNTVFSTYFRFVTIFDTLSQLTTFNKYFEVNLGFYIKNLSIFACKFRYYYSYVITPLSGWTLAIISFDRYLSIAYPTRFLIRKKIQFQIIVCCFIFTLNAILFTPWLNFTITLTNSSNQTNIQCNISNGSNFMGLIGKTVLPFSMMIIYLQF